MANYVYPAVLTQEGEAYNVVFPDLDGCYTCGYSLSDALMMAEDALSIYLMALEDRGEAIPAAHTHIQAENGQLVTLIKADTDAYRNRLSRRAVKKTLTIPQWMNEAAIKRGLNFSQVLQEALAERLS